MSSYERTTERSIVKSLRRYFDWNVEKFEQNPQASCLKILKKTPNEFDEKQLIFFDENWERVINRWNDRKGTFWGRKVLSKDNHCPNKKVIFKGNNLIIRSQDQKDDWIYILDKREFKNFALAFEATFFSEFREIQFGFRHVDFYNRYRFRIEAGILFFDIVYRGKFFNSIEFVEFKPEVGKMYRFEIIVRQKEYFFSVDGNVLLSVKEKWPILRKGTFAIILWDLADSSQISADYCNVELYGLND